MNESFCRYFDFDYDSEEALEHKRDLKEYAEHIRNKTIDECIDSIDTVPDTLPVSEIITNLTNLKNNE